MGVLIDNRKTVAVAGTREALSGTSVPIRSVTITAETDNTGVVVVGGLTVVAALATRRGIPLNAGDSVEFSAREDWADDLAAIQLDVTVSGDGVTYVAGLAA